MGVLHKEIGKYLKNFVLEQHEIRCMKVGEHQDMVPLDTSLYVERAAY